MASVSMGDTEIKKRYASWLAALCAALSLTASPLPADDSPPPRPEYNLDIDLWPGASRADVTQRVTWTNPGTAPTSELVFQVVPNNKLSPEMIASGERTIESLRLKPEQCIDYEGRRFRLHGLQLDTQTDQETVTVLTGPSRLRAYWSRQHDTHLHVKLPAPVAPGETVSVHLRYSVYLPQVMGRLGQYKGVTNLLNWHPVLAVYRDDSWRPVPYVPWHQPWHNEAADYEVRLRTPAGFSTVTGGHVTARRQLNDGRLESDIRGTGQRDFTIITSQRFRELKGMAGETPVRIQFLPEHESHARVALKAAIDSIKLYTQWFGPYPYQEFELSESFFGWNGNESSGVVMIDSRIFALPDYAARYVEHLVSHEVCHQWWYSAVGTDGFHEPWMDEGLVTWFTRVRMEDRYGANPELLDLPGYGIFQFPNVDYYSVVHSGYSTLQARGGSGKVLQNLNEIGNLHKLFFLVYDRGARVTGMIQQRMGRENFFKFMRHVYQKYKFRILTAEAFFTELQDYTGEDWAPFIEQWLLGDGSTDWSVEDVNVDLTVSGYRTEARIRQNEQITESVEVGFTFADGSRRMTMVSDLQNTDGNAVIRKTSDNDWLVTVVSSSEPTQVTVDPRAILVDSKPANNSWATETTVRVSPVYTPADESDLLTPWEQPGIVGGFGVDGEGRIGFRATVLSGARYRISPFLSYTSATSGRNADYLSAGIEGTVFNFPSPNWQLRATYEAALLSTVANDPGQQAKFALRRVLSYTTSVIYPDLSYIDFYTRFGDNFFPDNDGNVPAPGVQSYGDVRAFGIDYHLDTQMPYWDPDRGLRVDANYEHGFHANGGNATYNRVSGQLGVVQRLSDMPGWLSETKLAARLSGGYGWSENGEHFRFGGPGRFRGRNALATEGNAFWLSSLEWRFPMSGDIDFEVLDNTAALSRLDGALFYDVGRSYLMNSPQGQTDHAIGAGVYWQIPLLSFVDNLTIRTEYGYSMTNDTGVFWFGLYRAF